MHRFFLTETDLSLHSLVDLQPLAHQLARVLRLQPGANIVVCDNRAQDWLIELREVGPTGAHGLVVEQWPVATEPAVQVTLYQCSLKVDKMEWVLQKGTELGVSRFVPVISQRSVVRPAAALLKKFDRWRHIVREAAEQSHRGRLPELLAPLDWEEAVRHADGAALRLLPWEESKGARTLSQGLSTALPGQSVSLLIGPEGGLAAREVELAGGAGWQIVSLGPRILRAETAAIASLAVTMDRLGELA